MKKSIVLANIILTFLTINCANKTKIENTIKNSTEITKQQKIEKIQLTERTRGVYRNSVFTPKLITATSDGDSTQIAISPSEWDNISRQAEALDLSKISNLQSPTTGRFSDRALAATIMITSNGTTYTSSTFDAGRPPKELEALYNTIQNPKKNKK